LVVVVIYVVVLVVLVVYAIVLVVVEGCALVIVVLLILACSTSLCRSYRSLQVFCSSLYIRLLYAVVVVVSAVITVLM